MAAKFSMASTGLFDAASHVEASERMQVAMEELKVKHEREDRAQAAEEQQQQKEQQRRALAEAARAAATPDPSIVRPKAPEADDKADDSDDEDYDALLDEDPELERLRELRLAQLQKQHQQRLEWKAKGHGEYREISQDAFLTEVTSSPRVLVHFYHNDFERCKILDMHLQRLAPRHLECKVLKLNAEKAPFFVDKLQIRVLPTLVGFRDGESFPERVIGFAQLVREEEEEVGSFGSLAHPTTDADAFPTVALARRLEQIGVIDHNDADDDADAE